MENIQKPVQGFLFLDKSSKLQVYFLYFLTNIGNIWKIPLDERVEVNLY